MTEKREQLGKKEFKWQYQILWEIEHEKDQLGEQAKVSLPDLLKKACQSLDILLEWVSVESNAVEFMISADMQLNMNKMMKILQKKCVKCVRLECWKSKTVCISVNDRLAGEDARIEKLLGAVTDVAYYDLDEMFDEELKDFKIYLKQRKLGVIDWGDRIFLVDKEALKQQINLNCFECTKIHKYGCCSGRPCEMSRKNQAMLKMHSTHLEEDMQKIDPEWHSEIVASGGIWAEDDMIKEWQGRCALLVEHEGVHKCMAHKYALENDIPIYEICPLSCLMYPLEMLELLSNQQNKIILLTSVLEDEFATQFGRWGSYRSLAVDLRCLDKNAHNEIFRQEAYQPVYRVNQNLLIHELGKMVYWGIERLLKEEKTE